MNKNGTSVFENGLIWFGAAVSIAEIITGTYFAPLGFLNGTIAIILGHILGCVLMLLAGVIGGKTRKSSMETVKMSFGRKGSCLFAVLNIIQLIGWTGIMIYDASVAANGLWGMGNYIWALLIGALIILWIVIGIRNLGKLNTVAMAMLFVLTIVMSFVIFRSGGLSITSNDAISFGAALELSIAMPISWLPLISDYTREAEKPVKATLLSVIIYGIISAWMYFIGMSASIFTGEYDIAQIMLKAGLGITGLLIIVISTVTTTFLDAYSAGISSSTLTKRLNEKWIAVFVTVIGTAGAIVFELADITEFLYFIGSVFVPMVAIQIADYFIIKRNRETSAFDVRNIVIWVIGFVIYRIMMRFDIIIGNTLPDMAITMLICILADKASKKLTD